jgi:hypothetical protein
MRWSVRIAYLFVGAFYTLVFLALYRLLAAIFDPDEFIHRLLVAIGSVYFIILGILNLFTQKEFFDIFSFTTIHVLELAGNRAAGDSLRRYYHGNYWLWLLFPAFGLIGFLYLLTI